MQIKTIGFIGLGLIGGSIARKIKEIHPDTYIMAYMRTRATLEQAKADGIVDQILEGVDASLSACDMIILCTPVDFNDSYLRQLKPLIRKDCIITDVGSTKTSIHETVIELDLEANFVGGHPMAGSERTGYACSKASLLENAYYVITPTAKSTQDQVDPMTRFASEQKALPLVLDYRNHDYAVAAISHVPHVIAAALVNLVAKSDFADGTMKRIAAGGFKDITRIASSSPVMWEQILFSNRENVISLLEDYKQSVEDMIQDLKQDRHQAVFQCFEDSGRYRSSISDRGSATMNPEYAVYCDIPDKPGAISVIASLFTFENISIKNIGINHNREHMAGTLKIEIHDKAAQDHAAECLTHHHYTVYTK